MTSKFWEKDRRRVSTERKTPARKSRTGATRKTNAAHKPTHHAPAKTVKRANPHRSDAAKKNTNHAGTVSRKGSTAARKKRNRARRAVTVRHALVLGGLVACAAIVLFLLGAGRYTKRFIPGTILNGMPYGSKDVAEVEKELENDSKNYQLTIGFRGGTTEVIRGTDIGFHFDSNGAVQKLVDEQNRFAWMSGFLGQPTIINEELGYTYDASAVDAIISSFKEMNPDTIVAPVNAGMTITEDNQVQVVPEVEGTKLVEDNFRVSVKHALSTGRTILDLTSDKDVYEQPAIRATDETLNARVEELNKYASVKVSYTMTDGNVKTLSGSTITSWFKQDETNSNWFTLSQEDLKEGATSYILSLADYDDQLKATTTFHSTLQGDVQVPISTTWGHAIDQSAMTSQLLSDFSGFTSGSHDLTYSMNTTDPTYIGDTYVEVDIGYQKCFLYLEGRCVLKCDIVSGTETDPERKTPSGVFEILEKLQDHTMRGSYGEAQGAYVMAFAKGGLCLHDASWRGNGDFGGTIYQYDGSHGCINMTYDDAKYLYEHIQLDYPVIVFRPD